MSYNEPQGAPYVPGPVGEDPGKTMGIVGLLLSILVCGPVGAIVSYLAMNKSKQAGFKNTVALVGLIWGLIGTVGSVVYMILVFNGVLSS